MSSVAVCQNVSVNCGMEILSTLNSVKNRLNLQAPCILYIGQAFRYSPENAFYIFNQQIYFII